MQEINNNNIQITINKNKTTTLQTANKYCDQNIDIVTEVTPSLQSKTATANGTITADSGYDGLSSVVVNIPDWDGSIS